MKRLFVIVILILTTLVNYLSAQEWIRYYGQGQNAVCQSISTGYDNGVIIGGMIDNYKYLWVNKIDVNGNTIWSKMIGNGTNDFGIGNIEQTDDGGYILCGSSTLQGSWDAIIIKLNACADIEWCKVLNTPENYDRGLRIKETPEGNYVLMGGYFETVPVSNTSLFKFDSNGNLIWHQFYPLDSVYYQDGPYDLLIDDDGYLILTDRYYPDPDTISPAIIRHHFTKTDTSGSVLWDLIYGIEQDYYGGPWCLQKSNGAYYEAGFHLHSDMTARPGFVKLTKEGTPIYDSDIMTDVVWGGISSIDIFEDSLLIMCGAYYPEDNLRYDVFFKTDTLGILRKTKVIPLASASYWDACKTNDSKFIAIGNDYFSGSSRIIAVKVNSDLEYDSLYTQPFTYDSLCPYPIVSETINPTCDNVIVKVDEPFKEPSTTQLKVYPNPTDKLVTIELPKYLVVQSKGNSGATTIHHQWSKATLQLIDIQGKIQMQKDVSDSSASLQIDVSHLPAGMYQFRLLYQGKLAGGCKVMIQ